MKIGDSDFARLPTPLIEFKDTVRDLWNGGKFQFQVIIASTGPTFAGRPGEMTFIRNGTDGRGYVYMGSSWNLAYTWTADAS